jgi:hypothetical protein
MLSKDHSRYRVVHTSSLGERNSVVLGRRQRKTMGGHHLFSDMHVKPVEVQTTLRHALLCFPSDVRPNVEENNF